MGFITLLCLVYNYSCRKLNFCKKNLHLKLFILLMKYFLGTFWSQWGDILGAYYKMLSKTLAALALTVWAVGVSS